MKDPIYLDHNATTPVLPEVVDAMLPYLREHFGNPSSGHVYGRRAKEAVERARAQVAALIGAREDEIVFTGSGTEASNLAIRGSLAGSVRRQVVTSAIEHPATLKTCRLLEEFGVSTTVLPVDGEGRVSVDAVAKALSGKTALVTLMHANNETGVLQDVAGAGRVTREKGVLLHVDAAQSVGKVPVDVDAMSADLLSLVGHKLYAPKGVGALFVRRGVRIQPVLAGGGQERHLRPGTESVALIVALGAACERAGRDVAVESARQQRLRDRLEQGLVAAIPGIRRNGGGDRLPNTLNVRFPGVSGSELLARTAEIAASTGSACHEGGESASSVITAMGVSEKDALGSVRLTLGRGTSEAELDLAVRALVRSFRALTGSSA